MFSLSLISNENIMSTQYIYNLYILSYNLINTIQMRPSTNVPLGKTVQTVQGVLVWVDR